MGLADAAVILTAEVAHPDGLIRGEDLGAGVGNGVDGNVDRGAADRGVLAAEPQPSLREQVAWNKRRKERPKRLGRSGLSFREQVSGTAPAGRN